MTGRHRLCRMAQLSRQRVARSLLDLPLRFPDFSQKAKATDNPIPAPIRSRSPAAGWCAASCRESKCLHAPQSGCQVWPVSCLPLPQGAQALASKPCAEYRASQSTAQILRGGCAATAQADAVPLPFSSPLAHVPTHVARALDALVHQVVLSSQTLEPAPQCTRHTGGRLSRPTQAWAGGAAAADRVFDTFIRPS